jgi:hypothetical protein
VPCGNGTGNVVGRKVTITVQLWFNHPFFPWAALHLKHLKFYALVEFPLTGSIAECFSTAF